MREKICCDLCGKEFHTHMVTETRYHDYEPYEEERIYPNNDECHLIKNYICNDCFDNFEEIVREKMIAAGNTYVKELDNRLKDLKEQYEINIQKLRDECYEVERLTYALQNADLAFIDTKEYGFTSKFPYSKGSYYLDCIERVREMKQ